MLLITFAGGEQWRARALHMVPRGQPAFCRPTSNFHFRITGSQKTVVKEASLHRRIDPSHAIGKYTNN
jgi:hypothetical protein